MKMFFNLPLREKIFCIISFYLLIIILFACLYYCLWSSDVKHFIVSNSYKATMVSSEDLGNRDINDIDMLDPVNLKKSIHFKNSYEKQLELLQETNKDKLNILENLKSLKTEYDNLLNFSNSKIKENYLIEKNKILEDFKKEEIKEKEKNFKEIKDKNVQDEKYKNFLKRWVESENHFSLKNIDIQRQVKLHELELKYENYDNLKGLNQEQKSKVNNYQLLRNKLLSLKGKSSDQAINLKVLEERYETALKKEVNWLDFLYFSFISATTTGFGDIVPATTSARVAVMLEIILCVFIMGMAINLIQFKKNID